MTPRTKLFKSESEIHYTGKVNELEIRVNDKHYTKNNQCNKGAKKM